MAPSIRPDAPQNDPMLGTVIAGKYELIRLLGQGGMGAVYEGKNAATYKRCAVKVLLSPELAQKADVVKRFFREARASSVIESDHIVQIFDSGTDPQTNYPYMVMELLQAKDLEQTLHQFGALQPLVAAKLILQASIGLARAHDMHTVHRDIKPANIYLTNRETGDMIVKILDFGIAKVKMQEFSETSAGLTRTGSMLGTPLYMSPEQARGTASIDVRSDVWSLGVVMYELLSGSLPYSDANSLGELMVSIITADIPLLQDRAPWVPPELAEITHRAMSRDIDKRYQNAGELRDALNQILPDGPRITPDMLQGLGPEQRQFVAPRLELTDDGMLRATTRTGLAITTADAPPPKKSKAPIAIAAVAGTIAVGGAIAGAVLLRQPPETIEVAAPPVVQSVIVTKEVAVEQEAKEFDLSVEVPKDTEVEVTIDGEKAELDEGLLRIKGVPGATRTVILKSGDEEQTETIAVTATGLLPPKIELKKPEKTAARRWKPAARAAKPQAAAQPAAAAPPKKPMVETGMDEFQ